MTAAKSAYALTPRPRAFPTATDCAAEFHVTVGVWLRWVADGKAPPPSPAIPDDIERWCWADVETWFREPERRAEILRRYGRGDIAAAGRSANVVDPFIAAAGKLRHDSPPTRKRRGRAAA